MRAALLLTLAALAGCLDTTEDPALEAQDVPTRAAAGEGFTFQLRIDGDGHSDHIGAHYWSQSTSDPDGDFDQQAGACDHTAGDLPGTFDVTCVLDEGPVFLRGHLRTDAGDYWTQEYEIEVTDITLRAENTNATAEVDQPYAFDLHVEGDAAFSDHIGAHYWDRQTDDPTADFGEQAGACEHTQSDLPGVFEVLCVWDAPGTYHVFGHVRIDGVDLWSEAFQVDVS